MSVRRLLLFDIDGTLVSGGPAKEAFHEALVEAYGTPGDIEVHDFAGKTDPQIARELLTGAGLDAPTIEAGFVTLWAGYLGGLERRLVERPMATLPGVMELVDRLAAHADVALGLVTGNIADGAHLKLRSVGLHERFALGGYGSDSEERDHLPRVALERARGRFGVDFPPDEVIVVGDTPRDVACGRAHRLRTVAVATGRFRADELHAAGADLVLPDFADTDRVVEVLVDRPS